MKTFKKEKQESNTEEIPSKRIVNLDQFHQKEEDLIANYNALLEEMW